MDTVSWVLSSPETLMRPHFRSPSPETPHSASVYPLTLTPSLFLRSDFPVSCVSFLGVQLTCSSPSHVFLRFP